MTIEKLPSGSYRIKQMYEGKTYSVTVKYKPTQKDAVRLMAEKMNEFAPTDTKGRMLFSSAANYFIESKENVLSPRTIREYRLYIKRLPEWFVEKSLYDINQTDVQTCINALSASKSPKTVRCLHGFISAVLGQFRADIKLNTTLPRMDKKEPYIPSEEDISRILEYTKQKAPHFFVPLVLGCYSLRRSEICALQPSDIDDDNMCHINKALVQNSDGEWVVKNTKTTKSNRVIPIPGEVADIIREQGYVYKGGPQSIANYLNRAQDALGIPHFSLHKTRHYCASKLLDMGYSLQDVKEWCGWENDTTPMEIYIHSMKMKNVEQKKDISNKLAESIFRG